MTRRAGKAGKSRPRNGRAAPHPVVPVSTSVARVAPPVQVRAMGELMGRYKGPTDVAGLKEASQLLAGSDTIPLRYQRSPANCYAAHLAAQELGIGVITAMKNIFHNEQGEAGMKGALMQALIVRAGHRLDVVVSTEQVCRIRLTRCDGQPGGEAEWTLAEAKRAQLASGWFWISVPGDMLFWRALARAARRYASDVLCGFSYLPEELAERADTAEADDSTPVDVDVQEFLATLLDLPYAELMARWMKVRPDLTGKHAGQVDGRPFTVDMTVHMMLERARDDAEAAELAGVVAALVADADPVEAAPAGEGVLACGCDAAVVVATGTHTETCNRVAAFDAGWAALGLAKTS